MRSRRFRRRLFWTGVGCLMVLLAALNVALRTTEVVASAMRPRHRMPAIRAGEASLSIALPHREGIR
jgi:hypothetical protein